jgi:uncharacterized protein YbjT (DUF2867 family)
MHAGMLRGRDRFRRVQRPRMAPLRTRAHLSARAAWGRGGAGMILVTGGTGTVGRNLVQQLKQAGAQFKVLTRDPARAQAKGLEADCVRGDLADAVALPGLLEGTTTLFLLTNSSPEAVRLHSNAIHAAKQAGVLRVVRLSVLGADPQSPVQLARWHAQGDDELRRSGLQWSILRPGYFMQNLLGSAATLRQDGVVYGAAKQGRIGMIDARDIAAVAAKVLTGGGHDGQSLDLTGPQALGYDDVARQLSAALGRPVRYVDLAPVQYKAMLTGTGVPAWLAEDYVAMQGAFASGAAAKTTGAVEQVTGRKPRTLEQFAKDHAKAFA